MRTPAPRPWRDSSGTSLVEILIALVILAVGILAVGKLFPMSSQNLTEDRLRTSAAYYSQEKLEDLLPIAWGDTAFTEGRHPPGTATESLGSGKWQRFYEVQTMAAPLNNLKKITVTVSWTYRGAQTVTAITYKRR